MRKLIRPGISLFVLAALFTGMPAAAAPKMRLAKVVRVKVGNGTRRGIGLHACSDGWHLELGSVSSVAEVIDVTPSAPARTLTLAVRNEELLFEPRRFIGGHVYQVQLFSGDERRDTLWVVLFPSARLEEGKALERPLKELPQHFKFVDDEPALSDEAIQTVAKSL